MLYYQSTDLSDISYLREKYFEEIVYSQELMLEWMINEAQCFLILDDAFRIGYFIKNADGCLLEFYLSYNVLSRKEEIFRFILDEAKIEKAFCKSFDNVLLTCCHTFCKSSRIYGTIFRDYSSELDVELDNTLQTRLADENDIPALLVHKSGLYESPEELNFMIANRMIHLFEKESELIGCGYLSQILPDKNYYDIGMWVNPRYRSVGYAQKIISYLKIHCFEYGYIPVCGCHADNIASRKVLEKNGFVSKYCILEFDF